jgi:peroxiredoxin
MNVGNPSLLHVDWSKLPIPQDDGAARHLEGGRLPDFAIAGTGGVTVNLGRLTGRTVVFVYPMTGMPGVALPAGWDALPGARGCTPQACAFRDSYAELSAHGADRIFGLSAQNTAEQEEAAGRLHLPFPLLSDAEHALADALNLPTMEIEGRLLLKRLTLIADDQIVAKIFYPVFPPDRNADEVLAWLKSHPR